MNRNYYYHLIILYHELDIIYQLVEASVLRFGTFVRACRILDQKIQAG